MPSAYPSEQSTAPGKLSKSGLQTCSQLTSYADQLITFNFVFFCFYFLFFCTIRTQKASPRGGEEVGGRGQGQWCILHASLHYWCALCVCVCKISTANYAKPPPSPTTFPTTNSSLLSEVCKLRQIQVHVGREGVFWVCNVWPLTILVPLVFGLPSRSIHNVMHNMDSSRYSSAKDVWSSSGGGG